MTEEVTDRDERILLLLGELKEGLAGMREDMAEVKEATKSDRSEATESRRRIWERLETTNERLVKMEGTVTVLGGVVAKQTERIDKLEPVVKKTATTVQVWTFRWAALTGLLTAVVGGIWWVIQQNGAFLWNALLKLIGQGGP